MCERARPANHHNRGRHTKFWPWRCRPATSAPTRLTHARASGRPSLARYEDATQPRLEGGARQRHVEVSHFCGSPLTRSRVQAVRLCHPWTGRDCCPGLSRPQVVRAAAGLLESTRRHHSVRLRVDGAAGPSAPLPAHPRRRPSTLNVLAAVTHIAATFLPRLTDARPPIAAPRTPIPGRASIVSAPQSWGRA